MNSLYCCIDQYKNPQDISSCLADFLREDVLVMFSEYVLVSSLQHLFIYQTVVFFITIINDF